MNALSFFLIFCRTFLRYTQIKNKSAYIRVDTRLLRMSFKKPEMIDGKILEIFSKKEKKNTASVYLFLHLLTRS